jgi:hypothetical protein
VSAASASPKASGRRALAPRPLDHLDLEPVPPAELDPALREHAVPRGEDLVAGRQRVGDRGLPAGGAGGREDQYLRLAALQHPAHAVEDRPQHLAKAAERWSIVGRSTARRSRSGMLVGPGMKTGFWLDMGAPPTVLRP